MKRPSIALLAYVSASALACATVADPTPPEGSPDAGSGLTDAAAPDAAARDAEAPDAEAAPDAALPDADAAPDGGTHVAPTTAVSFPVSPCVPLAARSLTTDGAGHIFVAALCGPEATSYTLSAGQVFVARSTDDGATFTAGASAFGDAVVLDAKLVSTAPDELAVFARLEGGVFALARSHDGGQTWPPARRLAVIPRGWAELDVLPFEDELYLLAGTSTGTALWRSGQRGGGELTAHAFETSGCISLGVVAATARVLVTVGLENGRVAAYTSDDHGASFTRAELAARCLGGHVVVGDQLIGIEEDVAAQRALFSWSVDTFQRQRRAPIDPSYTTVRGFAVRSDATAYQLAATDVLVGGTPGRHPRVKLLVFPPQASVPSVVELFEQPWDGSWFSVHAAVLPVPGRSAVAVAWAIAGQLSFQLFDEP